MVTIRDSHPRSPFVRRSSQQEERNRRFAAIILAAGASPQKAGPTQLRRYLGRTLIEHVARTALASGASEVVVVIASHADAIRKELAGLPVRIAINPNSTKGIAGSIRAGVSCLSGHVDAAVICLCDQPKVTAGHLRALADTVRRHDGIEIAASSFAGVLGAPAAFDCSLFERLMALDGDVGARELIRSEDFAVAAIPFDEAAFELDPQEASGPAPAPRAIRPWTSLTFRDSGAPRAPPVLQATFLPVR